MAGRTVLDTLVTRIGPEFFGAGALRKLETGVAAGAGSSRRVGYPGSPRSGAGLTAGAALTVKTLFGFEVAQNQLQATLDVTADKMARAPRAGQGARAVQPNSRQPRRAEAQVQLAQAGFDLNQILASTPAVLALASAGQLSMAEAAKLTANQLRAFNLDVDQAGRVTDVLAPRRRARRTPQSCNSALRSGRLRRSRRRRGCLSSRPPGTSRCYGIVASRQSRPGPRCGPSLAAS